MNAGGIAATMMAVLATAALVAGSRMRFEASPSEDALLRVAWSARPERVERCRTIGEEELAAKPVHMRQHVVCEGTSATYRIDIRRDSQLIASDEVRGGGLRHDRQLYHFRELPVPSGPAFIEVLLTRVDSPVGATSSTDDTRMAVRPANGSGDLHPDDREHRQRRLRIADELPSSIVLRERITLRAREVLLVTYDREARQLRMVRGGHDR